MINQVITNIQNDLLGILDEDQMTLLSEVLAKHLLPLESATTESKNEKSDMLPVFIAAKRVEGCSEKSLRYYESTIRNMLESIGKLECQITTEDLRFYLDTYQRRGTVSKVTLDNVRRILSSFFAWLEDEGYIVKSPVRRIHKVKTGKTVKETYSDESLELMRDHCDNTRDLAMIDLLASTGIRVGELVKLNRSDVGFENRECIVFGKGNKQRKVYFDARTKIHLQRYLNERTDTNEALFVSLLKPFDRLQISGVEIRLRKIGRELSFHKVHPHKFRRTLATMAIDKGMPIEQVQQLLGHQSIDTTLQYAIRALCLGDIDWENSRLSFIQSKTQKRVDLPLPDDVGWAIIDYLKYGRPKATIQNVFLTGRTPIMAFSDTSSLSGIIVRYARMAKIDLSKRKHGMHSLRHTLATRLMEENIPISTIANILGHTSTDTVKKYLQVDTHHLRGCALDVEVLL